MTGSGSPLARFLQPLPTMALRTHTRSLLTALPLLLALPPAAFARPQDSCLTWRMSTDSSGLAGDGWCRKPSLSSDGDWVAFESTSSDLVAGDTNGLSDIFVRQISSGAIERVSVATSGAQADADCEHASISGDGRFVCFESEATNLLDGAPDTNGVRDVFVRDRLLGSTLRVSVPNSGALANGPSGTSGLWRGSDISGDGQRVVFQSFASNLVSGDTNQVTDIFLHDLGTQATTLVSRAGAGPANGSSQDPVISDDGAFVAFRSSATNLAPGDTNAHADIYRVQLATFAVTRVSLSTGGLQPDGECGQPDISGHGDFVVFESFATNLVPADTNAQQDIFWHDANSGATERVSLTWTGSQNPSWSKSPSLSHDGTRVAFTSNSSALIQNGSGIQSVYLRDRVGATTERWGESSTGAIGFAGSDTASLSAAGTSMAFASLAALEPNDVNNLNDIYLRRCGPTGTAFCQGLADTCACANAGVGGAGCDNSQATGGGWLVASGLASVQADSLVLDASGLPNAQPILFFQGTSALGGGFGIGFGDGLRCVGGAVARLGVKTASAGSASYGGAPDVPISVRGAIGVMGQSLFYQAWYRDPVPYCSPAGFNLTNGVSIVWAP